MAVATRVLDLHLLSWNGLVKARISPGMDKAEVLGAQLEGENMRGLYQDPFNPRRLYACSVTDTYLSEDGGETTTAASDVPATVRSPTSSK